MKLLPPKQLAEIRERHNFKHLCLSTSGEEEMHRHRQQLLDHITALENIPKTMEEITHIEGTHGGEF